ncbi:MAG TPA: oligosaccharide flippase family protein [Patescibacteria group bacterium]|nr:oligosaccharide flippase family protein [Patescibacteria group bacterium]
MSSYSVAQNTSFLTAASILQKAVSFIYFTVIARVVGVENTGQYFFAITFTTIFTVVADFGLGPVLTRETAKYPENTEKYVNTVFWTKLLFGGLSYLLVLLFSNLLHYSPETKLLIYLSGITMLFDTMQTTFYSIFRARKNLIYEAIGVVGVQTLTLIIGTLALLRGLPLYWLILAYTIPSFINLMYVSFFVRRVYQFRYRFAFDRSIGKTFLTLAIPFAFAGILSRLYSSADSILMSKMLTQEHLGWWSVPYKITFAFQFIPIALSASVYPVMSALSIGDTSKISELFGKAWRYLAIIVFPLAGGLFAVARPAITTIYGASYAPSVTVLHILLISLIFGYFSFLTGALLNATNHQKHQMMVMGAALVANLILNWFLLPQIDIQGAAIATLVGNTILFVGGYYFSSRFVRLNHRNNFLIAVRAFFPAVLMSLVVYFTTHYMHFMIAIPIGIGVYAVLLFLFGGMTKELLYEFKNKIFVKETNTTEV